MHSRAIRPRKKELVGWEQMTTTSMVAAKWRKMVILRHFSTDVPDFSFFGWFSFKWLLTSIALNGWGKWREMAIWGVTCRKLVPTTAACIQRLHKETFSQMFLPLFENVCTFFHFLSSRHRKFEDYFLIFKRRELHKNSFQTKCGLSDKVYNLEVKIKLRYCAQMWYKSSHFEIKYLFQLQK